MDLSSTATVPPEAGKGGKKEIPRDKEQREQSPLEEPEGLSHKICRKNRGEPILDEKDSAEAAGDGDGGGMGEGQQGKEGAGSTATSENKSHKTKSKQKKMSPTEILLANRAAKKAPIAEASELATRGEFIVEYPKRLDNIWDRLTCEQPVGDSINRTSAPPLFRILPDHDVEGVDIPVAGSEKDASSIAEAGVVSGAGAAPTTGSSGTVKSKDKLILRLLQRRASFPPNRARLADLFSRQTQCRPNSKVDCFIATAENQTTFLHHLQDKKPGTHLIYDVKSNSWAACEKNPAGRLRCAKMPVTQFPVLPIFPSKGDDWSWAIPNRLYGFQKALHDACTGGNVVKDVKEDSSQSNLPETQCIKDIGGEDKLGICMVTDHIFRVAAKIAASEEHHAEGGASPAAPFVDLSDTKLWAAARKELARDPEQVACRNANEVWVIPERGRDLTVGSQVEVFDRSRKPKVGEWLRGKVEAILGKKDGGDDEEEANTNHGGEQDEDGGETSGGDEENNKGPFFTSLGEPCPEEGCVRVRFFNQDGTERKDLNRSPNRVYPVDMPKRFRIAQEMV
ncbi:unnamed protein product [Amoebophrya sp. A25]|nr:unnamed protein product [Amoebophrya sp. A25]|eukprot:GSA25T00021043001.1